MALLSLVNFDFQNDILYICGDWCDRGPDSEGVLELSKQPWCRGIQGNHEVLLMQAAGLLYNPCFTTEHYSDSGGDWAIRMSSQRRLEYAKMAAALPVVIVIGEGEERINLIHAEFYGDDEKLDALEFAESIPWETMDALQWSRAMMVKGQIDPICQKGLSRTFSGHNKSPHVYQRGSQIMLDTGAYMATNRERTPYGLTLMNPYTREMWKYEKGMENNV